ncbi:MAG: transcription termination factor Rho [Lachnospiraceae bacterium]|nr:transcription termination factor Rho [Lachnospiraceae bacterium]
MKEISTLRKAQLIDAMVAQDEKDGLVVGSETAGNNQEEGFSSGEKVAEEVPEAIEPVWEDVFSGPEVSEPYSVESAEPFSVGTGGEEVFPAASGAEETFSAASGTKEALPAAPGMEESFSAPSGTEEPFFAASGMNESFPAASGTGKSEPTDSGTEEEASVTSGQADATPEESTVEAQETSARSENDMVRGSAQEKGYERNAPGRNRMESGRQEERTYRNTRTPGQTDDQGRSTRTAGQTDDQGRNPVRRRRVTENETRTSYDRGNGERRTYDRTRTRTDQNNSYDNRRSYGSQNNYYDNRRNYGDQNTTSDSHRNYGSQNNSYDSRRNYGDQSSFSDSRRNYGEQSNSYDNRQSYSDQNHSYENRRNYGEQDSTSDTRRSYAESNSSYDSRKNYGERVNSYETQEEQNDNRRNDTNQNTLSEARAGYENAGSIPQASAAAEQRLSDADRPPAELSQLDSGQSVSGILEVMPDGYGFIRSDNYLPGENDVYVSPSQIRRFNLKTGDIISGNTRIKSQQEKFSALLYLKKINGLVPSEAMKRFNFEDMTPIFPNERLRMEREPRGIAMRIMDLFSPIGKGQRGMIVSPPKAGKTTLLKDVARSILKNNPEMQLLILLIDERPEEVTDIKEAICGENVEVIYSTFDETPEHHKRVSEMVIERAKRLVEQKQDVTILLDSITRLARAYNLTVPPSGRTLSGGLDPAALHMPKRFFGAARNMREGGSLTILATALVDTGSKMDDVVYEEFKGTGNMELVLDRKLSERRVFPAIDIPKSGTRREDLLLDREEQEAVYYMRRALNGMKSDDAVESILNMLMHTRDNRDFVTRVRRQKGV